MSTKRTAPGDDSGILPPAHGRVRVISGVAVTLFGLALVAAVSPFGITPGATPLGVALATACALVPVVGGGWLLRSDVDRSTAALVPLATVAGAAAFGAAFGAAGFGTLPGISPWPSAAEQFLWPVTSVASAGGAVGFLAGVGYARQATELERLRARERRLRTARERLLELARVLRHDVRNDVQVILGTTELLLDDADATHRSDLETIRDTAAHVVDLTRDARDVERTVSGVGPNRRAVPLAPLVEDVVARRREAFGHARFSVGPIPDVAVAANGLLAAVFRNLLNNAVQHSDRATPKIEVTAGLRDGRVHVAVADDGPGIPEARKSTVFDAGESGVDSRGTGLGLYLVRTLVDGYGGEVRITDNDPEGAVVHVELPIVEE